MRQQNQTDETLVMLTLAGDQSAYETLVVRYQRAVIASAAQITRSQFMAEDAAQDAFVTAWMKLNTLQEADKFARWVCRIAKNCAKNMVMRYRSFIDMDLLENVIADDPRQNPAELYAASEEKDELHKSLSQLPEKVGQIIRLHYFEGLSVAEIADRMRISEGTVKWQLHDGRKRIRKELCAMNERYSDTLAERVMKKVEELKMWQLKSDKSGFEAVYKDVLREVEDLPESGDKYRALADVLMRGWWWLPGEKNDALFARIKDAAIRGKNDEVMEFIVTREDSKVYGSARIEFIRDKQIPLLEEAGFTRALGREWFWLGYNYFRKNKAEEGRAAYEKAKQVLNPSHIYYALADAACRMEEKLAGKYKDRSYRSYNVGGMACTLRRVDGLPRYWNGDSFAEGYLESHERKTPYIFHYASKLDGRFFDPSLKVGESFTGTDGTVLTFEAENETVETPAGTFEGCQVWVTSYSNYNGQCASRCFYKDGVGLVKFEQTTDGITETRLLKTYRIAGGRGLLPLAKGNTWEYADTHDSRFLKTELMCTVTYADEESAVIAEDFDADRLGYDENCWLDMVQQIANDYLDYKKDGDQFICDVRPAIERAEQLAVTPMEKAHTKAAASVARRILDTDSIFNPDHTASGHWNFFERELVVKKGNTLTLSGYNSRWSFEWKNDGALGDADTPLLYNDIFGILQDAAKCIWSDEWQIGAAPFVEYTLWDRHPIKTQLICEDGGTVTTKAGTFENCMKMSLDISGMEGGISYRGGKKEYYFAPGVGIVRTVNEYAGGAKQAVYELTAYEGTGEGYLPLEDGMTRRYDALNLTDGFVGSTDYTFVANDDGQIVIFADRTGIREIPAPITHYGAIEGEIQEEKLWNAGQLEESRLRHDVNNFRILCHFLGRNNRNWAAPQKAAEWGKYHIRTVESLAEGGDIPRAWLGRYWRAHFATACALFGCKTPETKEEGYRYLERAFELYPKWAEIPDGEALEVGNELIYGGIKLIKGKGIIELPDGTKEPLDYEYLFHPAAEDMYRGMTAPRGWEWFNSVRQEDRFKEYVERARKLTDTK